MSSEPEHSDRLSLPPGFRLEDYRIERLLGKGGFGLTYLAVDEKLDAQVAIKELLPDGIASRFDGYTVAAQTHALDETFKWARDRFLEEARTLARLSHPSIVRVVRLMQAHGTAYMVMEFVEGESFTSWMKKHPQASEEELLKLLMPLLDGLDYIHQKGLLHRDIKPDNIFITPHGRPILLDFGSARADLGRTVSATTLVSDGYSPREQYQQMSRQGPYSDLYALAAVMVHAMTGKKPSGAIDRWGDPESDRPLHEIVPRHYSPAFLAVIQRAFAVAPEKRWQTVGDMRQEMQRTVSGLPSQGGTRKEPPSGQHVWTGPNVPPPMPPDGGSVLQPVFGVSQPKNWPKIATILSFGLGLAAAIVGFPMEIWDALERDDIWWLFALVLILPGIFSLVAWRKRQPWSAMVSTVFTGLASVPVLVFTGVCIFDRVPWTNEKDVYSLSLSGLCIVLFVVCLRAYLVLRRERLPAWWRKVPAARSRRVPVKVLALASLALCAAGTLVVTWLELWDVRHSEPKWIASAILFLPPFFALWAWLRGASWAAMVTSLLALVVAVFTAAIVWGGIRAAVRYEGSPPGTFYSVLAYSPFSLLQFGVWIWGFVMLRRELYQRMREPEPARG